MRAAHQRTLRSSASPVAASLLLVLGACTSSALPESIWPPADFELVVEERDLDDPAAAAVRRFRALADGIVTYATAARTVADAATGTALPVYERASVYRLVPTSVRALARRIDRCGILELDRVQGERGALSGPSLALTWRAFGQERVITARGRLHGAMADVLAVVASHLPEGEGFALQQATGRPVVPVLRGVPAPSADATAALQVFRQLAAERPDDDGLTLDAFALACALGQRSEAEELLRGWLEATAGRRRQQQMFPEQEPQLEAAILERMLPPTH